MTKQEFLKLKEKQKEVIPQDVVDYFYELLNVYTILPFGLNNSFVKGKRIEELFSNESFYSEVKELLKKDGWSLQDECIFTNVSGFESSTTNFNII